MSVCQVMLGDFVNNTGRFDTETREQLYDDEDLRAGIDFCVFLREEGHKLYPIWDFNLDEFIKWAKNKLKE